MLTTATALDATSSYGNGTLPTTTDDLTFTNSTYGSTTFTLNAAPISIGTLDDLDAMQALTITGSQSITLNGGANSVSGTPGDLFYVATGANLTVATTGGIALAASGNFDVVGTAQLNAVVSGAFSMTKTGAGTLTLGAANTYNGGTTISAGTLQLGDGTTGHDGSVTGGIANNASLVFNLFGNQTYGGVISGTGSLTKTGAGTLILANNETFAGGTMVNGGILQLNNGGGNGTLRGAVTVNTGGTLYLNAGDALGYNNGQSVTTLNVNGGTLDNRTGNNQGFITNFSLTGATVRSTGGGTFNFNTGTSITNNASATTTVFSGGLNIRGDSGANILPITVATGTTASGVDLLISGVVSQQNNTDGINKMGPGTLALSAANTYQGATTISGGTLVLGNGGTTGTISTNSTIVNNTAGGVFAVNRSNAVLQGTDFSGAAITGAGGFSQLGSGTTTLNAANTFTGPTTVNAGTLNLTGSLTSAVTVNTGGTLSGFGNGTTTGKISGNLTVAGGGALALAQGSVSTPFTLGGALTLGGTGSYGAGQFSTLNFTLGGGVEALNASGILTLNSGGAYINLSGATATGTYNLLTYSSQTGSGSFSLSSTTAGVTMAAIGRNTYTLLDNATSLQLQISGAPVPGVAYFNGAVSSKFNDLSSATLVNFSTNLAGTTDAGNIPGVTTDVILNAANAPAARTAMETLGGSTTINSLNVNGNGTTTLAADGSTLTINALADSNTASDGSYTGNTAGTGIAIAAAANAFTINVPVALGNSQTWTNNSANLFTVGGTSVTGTATTGNTQTLTLANTGAGGTTVGAVIGNGSLGGTLALTVNNTGTGTTILTANNTYSGGTTITAGTLQLNGTGVLGTGNIVDNGALVFNTSTAQTLNGNISGTGTLTQSGAGVLTLNGNSTFTGGLAINNGTTVNVNNGTGNLGAGAVTLSSTAGGTATLNFNNNNTVTYANNFVLNGGTMNSFDGDVHLGNATSTIAVNGATTIARQYGHGGTAKKLSFDGIVSGAGALTLNGIGNPFGEGGGVLIGNNANTYSGTITVNSTTGQGMALIDGGNTALRFATVNVQGNGTGDVPYGLRFNPGVTASVLGSLQGDGRILLQDLSGTPAAVVLTVGGNNADVTHTGVLSGTGGLTKAGTGLMTLNTADSFTGPTTVTGGTLTVPGSLPTSTVTVNAGTLNLMGSMSSSTVTVNGGTLNLSSTLTGSAVTVNSGGTLIEGTTGVIGGAGSLTTFSNTTLATTNPYTGATTIGGGTLTLTKAGTPPDPNNGFLTAGGTLAGTSGFVVNTGGTLVLGASNSVGSGPAISGTGGGGTSVTLSGGMLTMAAGITQGQGASVTGGMNDGSTFDVPGLGNLTLTATSTLNFAGASGTLVFNGLTLNGNALSIGGTHFATLMGNSADGVTDRFIVESDSGAPSLAGILFTNYGNSAATDIDLGDNFYEIIPINLAPVPEPSTWALGILGLGVLGYSVRRRSFGASKASVRAA